jgi:hypothetical protein
MEETAYKVKHALGNNSEVQGIIKPGAGLMNITRRSISYIISFINLP